MIDATNGLRPELQPLAFLLGGWVGTTTVYPLDEGADLQLGTIRGDVTLGVGGAWLEWNYEHIPVSDESLVRRARYSFSYSAGAHGFIAVYMDDRGQAMTEFESSADGLDGQVQFRGSMRLQDSRNVGFVDSFSRLPNGGFQNRVEMTIGERSYLHGIMVVSPDLHAVR